MKDEIDHKNENGKRVLTKLREIRKERYLCREVKIRLFEWKFILTVPNGCET